MVSRVLFAVAFVMAALVCSVSCQSSEVRLVVFNHLGYGSNATLIEHSSLLGSWNGPHLGSNLGGGDADEWVLTGLGPIEGTIKWSTTDGNVTVNCAVTPSNPLKTSCSMTITGSLDSPAVAMLNPDDSTTSVVAHATICYSCSDYPAPTRYPVAPAFSGVTFEAEVCLLNQLTSSNDALELSYASSWGGTLSAGAPASIPYAEVGCYTFTRSRPTNFTSIGVSGMLVWNSPNGAVELYIEVPVYEAPGYAVIVTGDLGGMTLHVRRASNSPTSISFLGIQCYANSCDLSPHTSPLLPVLQPSTTANGLTPPKVNVIFQNQLTSSRGNLTLVYKTAVVGLFSSGPSKGFALPYPETSSYTLTSSSNPGPLLISAAWVFNSPAGQLMFEVEAAPNGELTWYTYEEGDLGQIYVQPHVIGGNTNEQTLLVRVCYSNGCSDSGPSSSIAVPAPLSPGPYTTLFIVQNQLTSSKGNMDLMNTFTFSGDVTTAGPNSLSYQDTAKWVFSSPSSASPMALDVTFWWNTPNGQAQFTLQVPKFGPPTYSTYNNGDLGGMPVNICQIGHNTIAFALAVCYDNSCTAPSC